MLNSITPPLRPSILQHMSLFRKPAGRPEVEVLLACARTRMDSDAALRVTDALRNEIDWDFLVDKAVRHGMVPLLFRNLSRVGEALIPEATLKQLGSAVGVIARRNLSSTGELLVLLRLFGELGIRALPLKGPVLGMVAYGDLSLRPFNDLDILMPREDIFKAKEVLLQRGYEPKIRLSPTAERAYLKTNHDYKFTRAHDAAVVEIQWGITQWSFAFPIDFDEIWQRRQQMVLARAVVHAILADDLLLALCVHGAKHRWERLKWICDIAELVASSWDIIAWDYLRARARALGGERMLLLGLFLAHDLLETSLPVEVQKAIKRDSQIQFLAGRISARLFERTLESDELRDERPFFYWRVRERLDDKLAIARRYFPEYFLRMLVPNDRDRAFIQLPAFLSVGYYLVRPIRLIKSYWSEPRLMSGGNKPQA
jgi:hypothetical protein